MNIRLADETATRALGSALGEALLQVKPWSRGYFCIGLQGDLGAGKTTLADALVRALGVDSGAQSPTYALVNCYSTQALTVWHLDLYRIGGADDLPALGLDQYEDANTLWLVEWLERAEGDIRADVHIRLEYAGEQRSALMHAQGKNSKIVLQKLASLSDTVPA